MIKFEVYRNIRKSALIFGLTLPLFALLMLCIIASLLVIIFSFGIVVVTGALLVNTILYALLLRISRRPLNFPLMRTFPFAISNKKTSGLNYEEN